MFVIIMLQGLVRKGGWLLPLKRSDNHERNIKFDFFHIVYYFVNYHSNKTVTASR